MSDSKKVYGLILPQRSSKTKTIVKTSVFADDDDDDNNEGKPGSKPQTKTDTKQIFIRKQVQANIEKALAQDPSAFDYDEVYDEVQSKKLERGRAEKANTDCKPKFIHSLLKAADQRKKEDERRIERAVHREREAEKGLYDDKEAFVTESFRQKMKELKAEEEKERRKKEMEELNDVTKTKDYGGFYRNLLNKKTATSDGSNEKEEFKSNDVRVKDEKKHEERFSSKDSRYPQTSRSFRKEEDKKETNRRSKYESDSDSDDDSRDPPEKRLKKTNAVSVPAEVVHHTGDTDISMSESSSSEEDDTTNSDGTKSVLVADTEAAASVPSSKDPESKKIIFDKKTTGDAFSDARARYLARKGAMTVAVASDD